MCNGRISRPFMKTKFRRNREETRRNFKVERTREKEEGEILKVGKKKGGEKNRSTSELKEKFRAMGAEQIGRMAD